MRVLLLSCLVSLSLGATAQVSQTPDGHLVIGYVDSLYSEVLQEQREIWVHLPEGMSEDERYPVIYLLDPPAHFQITAGMLSLLTQWNMPKSILVGIHTEDRSRDLSPTHVPFVRGQDAETSGGAPEFARFVETELQPYIESLYPIEGMSTIIGHSVGGLFVIYAYIHHPVLFDNYLAIEPSLWWDAEALVSESEDVLARGDRRDKSLYVAVANSTGLDTLTVRGETSVDTEQLRANLRFNDLLKRNADRLDAQWDYFGTEDHSSLVAPALYDGLRSLFSWYPFPERWRFNTPEQYTPEELAEPFISHFAELSRRMKREVRPNWQFVNDVGDFMLAGHDAPDKALAYLELNLHFYPDSSKTHVALGNFHASQEQTAEATRYYEQAVRLDGNQEARDSLRVLIRDR